MDHNYEVRFAATRIDDEFIDDVKAGFVAEKENNDPNREGSVFCTATGHIVVAFNAHVLEEKLEEYSTSVVQKIWKKTRTCIEMTVTFINLDSPDFKRYHLDVEAHDHDGVILDSIREGASTEFQFRHEQFNKFFDSLS